MREIPLTRGAVALVDDADYPWLSQWKWQVSPKGYASRTSGSKGNRKHISLHRFIMDAPNGAEIDHINRNKLDNRRCNLRFVTREQNMANRDKRKQGTSAYKGVRFRASISKWEARIKCNRQEIYLGCFTSEIEAARAYDRAALEYFGEFARLNFPI